MRRRDPRAALTDALRAGETIRGFLDGKALAEYEGDAMLSSAVERQFEILGEALSRAVRAEPGLEEEIPSVSDVIGFRNVLAHGYGTVSSALVWSIASERLPELLASVRAVLERFPHRS